MAILGSNANPHIDARNANDYTTLPHLEDQDDANPPLQKSPTSDHSSDRIVTNTVIKLNCSSLLMTAELLYFLPMDHQSKPEVWWTMDRHCLLFLSILFRASDFLALNTMFGYLAI